MIDVRLVVESALMAAEATGKDVTGTLLDQARRAVQERRLDRGELLCRDVLAANPHHAEAFITLGLVLAEQGRLDEAERCLRRALAIRPSSVEAHNNLGVLLNRRWRCREAMEHFREALRACPEDAMLHCNLGVAQYRAGRFEQAAASLDRALALRPQFAEALHQRALVWTALGRCERAMEDCRRALALRGDDPDVLNTLGMALGRLERFAEARAAFEGALKTDPTFAQAHYNLANLLRNMGDCEGAIAAYDRAIEVEPDFADARWNRATACLLAGRLREGWADFGWRRRAHDGSTLYPHRLDGPRWDGSPLEGRRLLVHYEQGYGDSIQFWRFLPHVRAAGSYVLLEERPALTPLLRDETSVDQVIAAGPEPVPASEYDVHISLLDLPGLFGTTLGTIPCEVPYVRPPRDRAERLRGRVPTEGVRVGIVWAGSVRHENDRHRSCRLSWFLDLARVPGVRLVSLQKGPAEAELAGAETFGVVPLGPHLHDFADTAAVIGQLDLVISVDTAVAHLAGAMGAPVWTLLPFAPDWRWLLDRRDSPWYPTMRLFRQPTWGDWPSVFVEVIEALRAFAARQTPGG